MELQPRVPGPPERFGKPQTWPPLMTAVVFGGNCFLMLVVLVVVVAAAAVVMVDGC